MELECRHFSGYKPCARNPVCQADQCPHFSRAQTRVLVVHLEALGAVLRSTALLAAIHGRYPGAHVTWVTKAPAHHLLAHLPTVDRVVTTTSLLELSALEFDVALVIDKSLEASAIARTCRVTAIKGFINDARTGAILPATPAADELWQLGLSNHLKFFVNTKTEHQLVHEALELGPFQRDEHEVVLSESEQHLVAQRRRQWSMDGQVVIGLNTGCSPTLPAKKLSVEGHRQLIRRLLHDPRFQGAALVLLGGPEDEERHRQIAKDLPVIQSPTHKGLRDGLCSVAACDLVFSGDSLGMHMAIALRKWVVAWFGPSCAQEIDLYDRGVKLKTEAACSPCWKRVCHEPRMCYDQVDFNAALEALAQGLTWLTSSSRPHSPEISF